MAFLILGGVTVEAQTASAAETESTKIGEMARSFSGVLRSGVRAEKRAWTFTLIPMSRGDLATLRATFALDVPIVAGGDFNDGVDVTVIARISTVAFIQNGIDFLSVASLTLAEV